MLCAVFAIVIAQVTPAPSPAASPLPSASPGVLNLSPASVNLNPAQQRVVTVTGASAPLTLTLDRKLVNVTADPSGATVTITASQATGSDTLHVTDANGATADVAIRVAFNAGTILPQTTLTVTGDPAQPDWLAEQVGSWVARVTQAAPGARVTIGSVAPPASPLAPGASTQVSVPVQIGGNDAYFDQSGTTTVTVSNSPMQPFAPGMLFYDDDPEHVGQDGVLFRGSVSAQLPARLYYYHDAAGEDPRRLVVVLSTGPDDPMSVPTSVQVIHALAGPNMDVMQVGDSLTKRFLQTKNQQEGVVFDLAADKPYVLTDLPMSARQLIAGTVDLRVLSGGPIGITVLAVSPGVDPLSMLQGQILPGDGHHRTGVFSIAGFGNDALRYTAGGEDATTVLGDTQPTPPNAGATTTGHDYGDYGVIHTIGLTLENPTTAPSTAYLFFQPLAGPARGTFLIDGTAVQNIGCVRVPSRYQIAAFDLAPGTSSHVVQTMTDGGSFYPVRVGVTATAPLPTAPPVNAPDGCFPKAQPDTTQ